jgi:hypothetical protein
MWYVNLIIRPKVVGPCIGGSCVHQAALFRSGT